MDVSIRPIRSVIRGQSPSVTFSIEATPPSELEVVCASESALLLPEHRGRRSAENFYSTRESGAIRATAKNTSVGLSPDVIARLSPGGALYYAAAATNARGEVALSVDPRTSTVPSISYEPGFAVRASRRASAAPPSLTWSGDAVLVQPEAPAVIEDEIVASEASSAEGELESLAIESSAAPPPETAAPPLDAAAESEVAGDESGAPPVIATSTPPEGAAPPVPLEETPPVLTDEVAPDVAPVADHGAVAEATPSTSDPVDPAVEPPAEAAESVDLAPSVSESVDAAASGEGSPTSPTAAFSDDLPGLEHDAPIAPEAPATFERDHAARDPLALVRILVSLDPCVTFRGLDGLLARLGLSGERATALLLECVVAQGVAALDARCRSAEDLDAASEELLGSSRRELIRDTALLR